MNTVFARVAGLDVHLKTIQCAVRCRQESGKLLAAVRSFGTMTRDLRALADYLQALGVTHVALEATGVLWKPVWNVLEGRFTLLLVNPRHLKKVPGRKTDVSDAEWLITVLGLMLLFLFAGTALLDFLGITLDAFRVAGGILLFLIGIRTIARDPASAAKDFTVASEVGDLSEAESVYRPEVLKLH